MICTLKLAELTPQAQTDIASFVTDRFPGYSKPEQTTNIRITNQRVELPLIAIDEDSPYMLRNVHMQITDAIASAVLDALVGEKVAP